ncbi:MAG TPA: DUF6057 family protein [Ignavibacteriaceae bacterium]|nr:DUF6057 family protein [Ignavibacteriaceae bacterium]
MIRFQGVKKIEWDYYSLFLIPVFFISFFLYIYIEIKPELYYQYQEPVFFLDSKFFQEFLGYPGGLTDYIGAFLSQLYYYPWAGALVGTLLAWLIYLSAKALIKSVTYFKKIHAAYLIPAVLLLALYNNYNYRLSTVAGLIISLAIFNLFSRTVSINLFLRLFLYLCFSAILYFIVGAQFFLFAVLCIIFEIFKKRNYATCIFYAIVSAAIPYIAVNYFFIYSLRDAYSGSFAFNDLYKPWIVQYIFYLYFPFLMISLVLYERLIAAKLKTRLQKIFLPKYKLKYIVEIAIIFGGGGLLLYSSFDGYIRMFLRVNYYADQNDWLNVLNNVSPEDMNDRIMAFQFNRALYHVGELSEKMFVYPQPAGSESLILTFEIGSYLPMLRSDIFFELGNLNEAQHWACEALALNGNTANNLKRLALISILKSEDEVALKCLNLLDKTLLFRGWSEYYRKLIDNKSLISRDAGLQRIKSLMPKSDFIILSGSPEDYFKSLLLQNKSNKMAYEYLMAYYLLNCKLSKFINYLNQFPNFGYLNIPRHYEEAILAYIAGKGTQKFHLNYHPHTETINDFLAFKKILSKYGGNKSAARQNIMREFAGSYWAYFLYK